ncbi:hypothetical protein [Synechococcus sp. MIT S9507]|uniref:hypothetical protein n=1 Tax=Synechococcus sp. MIT S9507 TaxID=3082544 RepID=UPI0039B5E42C
MPRRAFHGLYLQPTGAPRFFSFVTYTPQSKEQMVACGDLQEDEEYINPVIFDFLLFVAEWILDIPLNHDFPIGYDDVRVICSRQRGNGSQHEYLIQISDQGENESRRSVLGQLLKIVGRKSWNGFSPT